MIVGKSLNLKKLGLTTYSIWKPSRIFEKIFPVESSNTFYSQFKLNLQERTALKLP
jgi:hypothetical protein